MSDVIITCDLSRYDPLVVTVNDVAELVVTNDTDVTGSVSRVRHHHVRDVQPA